MKLSDRVLKILNDQETTAPMFHADIETLADCLTLAKRVEGAPIGSLTDGGRDWVFYSQWGDVEKILDKRVAIVPIEKEGE